MFACQLFGIDRQVYYRNVSSRKVKQSKAEKVVAMVKEQRLIMPRAGIKKLYHLLSTQLQALNIGRDKLADILRANHLLIIPKRSYHITTDSYHRFKKHTNLILEMPITRPEQVWVSDITYIGKRNKPCYLSLVTDAYSKKIMGYYVSDNLTAESSVEALKMAIRGRTNVTKKLIHHSDRGVQYCSDEYQDVLDKYHIKCSMTNNGDPYENAVAERINGILKQEFAIDTYHAALPIIRKVVKEVIDIYNQLRPHYSNYMLTPNQMHQQSQLEMRTYKRKNSSKINLATV